MNAKHCFPPLFSVKPDLILLQAGFTITLIPPAVRPDYLETLEKAHTSDGDFFKLMARMVRETQKDFLRLFFV
jgi:hypothetical protein